MRAGLLPWVPVGLSLGIGIWFRLPFQPARAVYVALTCAILAALLIGWRAVHWAEIGRISWRIADFLRLTSWALLLVTAGFMASGLRAARVEAPVLGWRYYGPVEGRVVKIDRSARDRIRLTLDQVVLRDLAPEKTPAKVRLSLMDRASRALPSPGQRVMLTGHLSPPPGPASPDSFDFRRLAWFQGLGAVGYTRKPIMTVAPPEGGIWSMHRAQRLIAQSISDRIGGQSGAVAAALMTGDRSGITEATNEVMRASNLYHIISISGLHMGMLAGFIYGAARLALAGVQAAGLRLRWPIHKISALLALSGAAIYLWLSGGGVATERAFIMVAIMLVAILVDRRAISLRSVALAATLILTLNPEALSSPGFQMSFAATIALILTYGPWARIAPHLPIWLRPVLMLLVSSLVASIATAPIAAAHFSRMAQYGLLANLLAVPVMGTLVMPAGVIAALLAPFGLEYPALWVMGLGTSWMLGVAEFVAGLNGAVTAIALPPPAVLPCLGFGAVLSVLCWRRGRMGRLAPPLTGCLTGVALVVLGFGLWIGSGRPTLLIAPEGEAVGVMTTAGRAVSKAAGGGFVVKNWLLEDGDVATQETAANRRLWTGERHSRLAAIPESEWRIVHLTGKSAADAAPDHCSDEKVIVVVDAPVKALPKPRCLLLDLGALRQTGAVAMEFKGGRPDIQTTAQHGNRPWTKRDQR